MHPPLLVQDLGLILIAAAVMLLIFKWLKQPVIFGYLLAGFLVSPYFLPTDPGQPLYQSYEWLYQYDFVALLAQMLSIRDTDNIHVWVELGVIFMLFGLGLEFSFKKLAAVGGTAMIATFINISSMIAIGFMVGRLFGWSVMNSIFLGGMLSMSSTTIIIKAFNDMGFQKQKFAGIVFGMLIVEDLAAILMMVLLSTFAVSQHFSGEELFDSILKLGFFMIIWFVVGIFLIPTMLRRFQKFMNDETLLIISGGLCLGMVLFASSVGFSAALGAFIMGSILAETVESKRIEHLLEPLKNFFGAIFFVSVGMMIDPDIVIGYWRAILILTAVVIVGRIIFATLGVSVSGQSLKVASQSGFSLAQIGEFSFIIATLGISLGVIADFLYPVIVAVSVITTFATPYLIGYSESVSQFIEKRIPANWERLKNGYASTEYKNVGPQSDWKKLLKNVVRIVLIYTIICLAIIFLANSFFKPFVFRSIPNRWGAIIVAVTTILSISPFMRSMLVRKNKSDEFRKLWNDNRFSRTGLMAMISARVLICITLVMLVLIPLFPFATPWLFIISLVVIIVVFYSKMIKKHSRRIEQRFLYNLHSKERIAQQNAPIQKKVVGDLLDKDIHIEEIEVSQTSSVIGKTLRQMNFKQTTGVNVVTIIRGPKKINIPDGNELLMPYDKIVVVGSDEEIQNFMKRVDKGKNDAMENAPEAQYHIVLSQYYIEEDSRLCGRTVRQLNTREVADCMVIGIDRNGHSVTDNFIDLHLQPCDILWLAGEEEKLAYFGELYA
ncbi:MAG: cation:proton antiporter [Prolixibacteraceae bacterium]|nr:cation:proton antiporter [Prolixibacteraceae bacterium]